MDDVDVLPNTTKGDKSMRPKRIALRELAWQKASYCQSGECVEVVSKDGQVLVRNSQRPQRIVRYTPAEWQAFVQGVRAGEFDDIR
jgi:hypothetical protein